MLNLALSGVVSFTQRAIAQQTPDAQQLSPLQQQAQQARDLYHVQQFAESAACWRTIAQTYAAQSNDIGHASALSNLALSYQALGQWQEAQNAINNGRRIISALADTPDAQPVLAQVLMTAGSLQIEGGEPEQALETWQQAAAVYEHINDNIGQNRARINQAQALRELGFYGRSLQHLQEVATDMQGEPPSALKAIVLRRLGNALRLSGKLSQAEHELTQSLLTAQQIDDLAEASASLLSLGHTARSQEDFETAREDYAQALDALGDNPSNSLAIPIQLAQLSLYIESEDWAATAQLWPSIQEEFSQLHSNSTNIYHQMNWASILLKLLQTQAIHNTSTSHNSEQLTVEHPLIEQPPVENIAQQLQQALEQAKQLNDVRAEAYGLGLLGQAYEQTAQWKEATQLTQRALKLSSRIQATDMMYRWQWQLGKLWSHPNNPKKSIGEALGEYEQSINTLSKLRGDLAAADAQFSFAENVEPVYRETVALLLQTDKTSPSYANNLARAESVIESLRVAELDNYFREACADVQSSGNAAQSDPNAAIVYTIVFSDHLSILLNLPNQAPQHIVVPISAREVTQTAKRLRQELVIRSSREYFAVGKEAYDFLIAPIREVLDASGVNTLVFVPDKALQTIPLAALYDGEHFLIEDYAIGLTPSLTLIAPSKWLVEDAVKNQQTLIGGLTESRDGYSPLPYVEREVNSIAQTIDNSRVLLNQDFTREALAERLRNKAYPIVHIATHGKFGSTPEETFLLAWDGRINVREVNQILQANLGSREGIELLMLSACETALSDPNAGLGLAGVTIRSGAKSTLGTLWAVNDESTSYFTENFYQQLMQPNTTRANALRETQLTLLNDPQYRHPIYWAPYMLLGSWL
ncbi:MAG: CHAT domain-containing protein [Cyanobacteria bacterium P01_D01_bin.105]